MHQVVEVDHSEANTYCGPERRKEGRANIYAELGELKVRLAHIEHGFEEFTELKNTVDDIKDILTQSKGAVRILQIALGIVGPIVLGIYWIKDHIAFK